MKSLIQAVAIAAVLVAPVASFAQSQSTITRAQVREELVQLQKVGYRVGDGDQVHYPEAIQAAQAKVAAMNGNSAYGGVANTTESGARGAKVSAEDWNAMYAHP
ncbi:hypothetical protein LMG28688_01215 [Paraburkholderia caffeinitolerans]|uniref:DUF4148 domain-containing protein n=1 Tax=Paraburkholderia caffeinitolerans TaxID=1723730 RepID=A0A6J5FMY4_9BURK|nr:MULTISPECIES: DUF4148 domain-containing protein [Paraburkholderia]CAB3781482.1 hypothetical protein LMG28688_01215 [Paraburkholderia caffeinitolerans]